MQEDETGSDEGPTKKKGRNGQDAVDSCCKDGVMQVLLYLRLGGIMMVCFLDAGGRNRDRRGRAGYVLRGRRDAR